MDSFTSIYDNYIEEFDENFKINSLFLANCGTHGDYENKKTREIWLERAKKNQEAANELNLPTFLIDSNLHAFTHKIGEQRIGYLAIYSCIICLEKYISRYIISSTLSYNDIKRFSDHARDIDLAEYAESYMIPLISTERIEFVSDGCQYTREEKTERICEWNIARKYLNVCVKPGESIENCSRCHKCMRTLLVLEAMGRLNDFNEVFDIPTYHKYKNYYKKLYVTRYGRDAFSTTVIDYLRNHKISTPSKITAYPSVFSHKAVRKIIRMLNSKQ